MIVQPFILATAGHVDHGKSALVKALTGTDPDRLPEEKARGITIDLGFAHLELPVPAGLRPGIDRFSCGIVDVPGHEDFVRNMVAGVGSIDLALLVVAADDGWMPQTEEHLQILLHLGVTRAVVALTKADLAPDTAPIAESIRGRLADTPWQDAPLVPVSVVLGTGLNELRAALATVLADTPAPADLGRPRLWVDRVFVLRGLGTIVTGTLTGGVLKRGDPIVVQPGARPSRIRSCQTHGHEVDSVGPGTRTALNLADLASAESDPTGGVRRGNVVTTEAGGPSVETLDVVLERSPRLRETRSPAPRPLKNGTFLHFHLGSGHIPARVQLLQGGELAPGASAVAQLRLERPAFAFAGDRFILRDAAQQSTLAGGRVLDPDARQARAREPERVARLTACAAVPANPEPFLLLALRREGVLNARSLLQRSRFPNPEILAAVNRLVAAGQVVRAGEWITHAALWTAARNSAREVVDARHRSHPELAGLPLSELRAGLEQEHRLRHGFDELVGSLCREGFVLQGAILRRAEHQVTLPVALQAAGQRIRDALRRQPLDPPGRRELAPDPPGQQALRHLVQSGEAVEISLDVVLSSEAYRSARERVQALLREQGSATAGEIRRALATSRRVIIPLLEKLDREGCTRRTGDTRKLGPN